MDPPPKVHRQGGSRSLFPLFRFYAPFDYHTTTGAYENNIATVCSQQSAVRLQTMDPP